jgi:osmotically-inducible protein OsmY
MSLDDHVKASEIGVSTTDHVVTLTGTARSEDEHRRALELARETNGVKSVVDRIQMSGR